VQWLVDAYTVALASSVLTAGSLADRFGRRRSFAIGPLVGGVLTSWLDWRAVFLINVPIGLAALALVPRIHDGREKNRRTVDWTGQALLIAGLVLLVTGLCAATTAAGAARSCYDLSDCSNKALNGGWGWRRRAHAVPEHKATGRNARPRRGQRWCVARSKR
jgi:MFS family permease